MSKDKTITLQDKSDYITNLIKKQNGLKITDDKAYLYLYDIVRFLVKRKLHNIKFSSEIPEEIIQNVVVQIVNQHTIGNMKSELKSMFAYASYSIHSELCKLNRNKYLGQSYIISEHETKIESSYDEPDHDYFVSKHYSHNHDYEMEVVINTERVLKIIIKEVEYLLEKNIVPVKNKKLLLFPLLLSIAREDQKIINKFKLRLRILLKQFYKTIGSPIQRIKKY